MKRLKILRVNKWNRRNETCADTDKHGECCESKPWNRPLWKEHHGKKTYAA